jgi:hypothetical protein
MSVEEIARERACEGLARLESGSRKINLSAESEYDLVYFSEFFGLRGYKVKSEKAVKNGKRMEYPVNVFVRYSKEGNKNA